MLKRVWTIGAVAVVIVPVVTLFAIRPELADNPNFWVVITMAVPGLIATYKAEEGSKKTDEGNEQIAATRRELKNGTITKVVHDAIQAYMDQTGVHITDNGEDKDSDSR